MNAYDLSKNYACLYHDDVGREIGYGADGVIHDIKSNNNKVIKFSIHYCWDDTPINDVINSRLNGFEFAKTNPIFVDIHDCGYLGTGHRQTACGIQQYVMFFTLMDKLEKISDDELKVFHSILSHEDNNFKKDLSTTRVVPMLNGLSTALDFDFEKVNSFIQQVKEIQSKYSDLHPRNIMKSREGKFKLIDLDRITL